MAQVLIVDDNPAFRDQLADLLRRAGAARVHTTADIPQALKRMADCAYDLAVVDVLLPGTNGLEGARLLRERCPGLRIVLVSAYPQFAAAAATVGADAFFAKDDLDLATVRGWLRGEGFA